METTKHFLSPEDMSERVQSHISQSLVKDSVIISFAHTRVLDLYDLPDQSYFPGALPVSLMRKNLNLLSEAEYLVAEKTDGVRYLLLMCKNEKMGKTFALLVDRGFRFYFTNIKFSSSLDAGTLFDGEMIYEDSGYKFYIHDIVALSGDRSIAKASYTTRMAVLTNILRWSCFPPDNNNTELFLLLPKLIFPMTELDKVVNQIIPKLNHRSDGLIFTPKLLPHTGKKNKLLFKWKRPEDNTIDFQLDRQCEGSVGYLQSIPSSVDGLGPPYPAYYLQTWDTKDRIDFCKTSMSPERWKSIGLDDPRKFKGVILECKYHKERNMWVPITWRKDKIVPNDTFTCHRTIETMAEGLSMDELLNISRHLCADKNCNKQTFF